MSKIIQIKAGDVMVEATLNQSPTANKLWDALPINGRANRWGDEIYFSIPVQAQAGDDARADVEVGEIAYWPPGSAFCIFFGRTPASTGAAPRAASAVNPLGQVDGDAAQFKTVQDGASVRLTAIEKS